MHPTTKTVFVYGIIEVLISRTASLLSGERAKKTLSQRHFAPFCFVYFFPRLSFKNNKVQTSVSLPSHVIPTKRKHSRRSFHERVRMLGRLRVVPEKAVV
ncbi:hypothetical protein CEXT_138841 [Caerostris extrusa]|uniref:Secreted protein n=1 Tax=Caerostris extrusa TaxID=172846 RepID=A0AAV4Y0P0_CAEEX|nr:hypothetical protein CEXT_138841 [Caerostris extrusa]